MWQNMKAVEMKAEIKLSLVSWQLKTSVIGTLFACNRTTYTHPPTELSFPRVQTCFNKGLKIMGALEGNDRR